MSKFRKTNIQWSDYTVNPWIGCRKVSAGCKYCYMHRIMDRSNPESIRVVKSAIAKLADCPAGSKVFLGSMTDFFIEEGDQWRDEWWKLIKSRPDLIFQILTKRVHRIKECLPEDWGDGYPNVWLGVSIEDQKVADRVVELADFAGKNKLWLSLEPLIGPIDFLKDATLCAAFRKIDWIVMGGESGNDYGKYRYRECRLGWMYNLLAQCDFLQIPVFFKQLGTYLAKILNNGHSHGGNPDKFPKGLRRFDFPK